MFDEVAAGSLPAYTTKATMVTACGRCSRDRIVGPMQTLQAGSVVDQYRLIRPIGEGGFGTVWLAHSAILGAHVAVKVLNPAKPEAVAVELAAVRTYKAMAVSGAPVGLMPIEHVGVIDNQVFYVLPLADGLDDVQPDDPVWRPRTLAACIERQRNAPAWFSPAEIAVWLTPICSAAQILADAGLVHRDIKPDNIIFLHGLPVLSDISLLRTDSLTATCIGTPGYYAPSWYAGTGGKLDMFSIAATLFTLLTGHSPDNLGRAAFRWPPQGEASLTPAVREAWLHLHRVVLRATHDEPAERYLTFAAFGKDLRPSTDSEPKPSGPDEEPTTRRLFLKVGGVAVAAVAAYGGYRALRVYTDAMVDDLYPYVLPTARYGPNEFTSFLAHLSSSQQRLVLASLGKDKEVFDVGGVKKEVLWIVSNPAKFLVLDKVNYNYHEAVVGWVAREYGLDEKFISTSPTFILERGILGTLFLRIWDRLAPEHRGEILDKIYRDGTEANKLLLRRVDANAASQKLSSTGCFAGLAFYTTMDAVIFSAANFFGLTPPFGNAYANYRNSEDALPGPIGSAIAGLAALDSFGLPGRSISNRAAAFVTQLHYLKVQSLHDSHRLEAVLSELKLS